MRIIDQRGSPICTETNHLDQGIQSALFSGDNPRVDKLLGEKQEICFECELPGCHGRAAGSAKKEVEPF